MGCGFSRVTSDNIGISDFFFFPFPTLPLMKQCPFDDNLLSACLTSTQLRISANKTVQTFVVPSATFSNPDLTEAITVVPLKGFPFPSPHSFPLPPLGVTQGYHVHL